MFMTFYCPALLAYYWIVKANWDWTKKQQTVTIIVLKVLPHSAQRISLILYFLIKFPIKITSNSLDKYITIQADQSSFYVSITN